MASLPFADRELCGFRTWKGGGVGGDGGGRRAVLRRWDPRPADGQGDSSPPTGLDSWACSLFCAEGGCCEGRGA